MDDRGEGAAWPARAILFLLLGAICGFLFGSLIQGSGRWVWTDDALKLGAAAFVASAGIAFAFSLERQRPLWSILFALVVGLVVGSVTWRNGGWSGWGANEKWQLFSGLMAVAIAVPLFQTARDAGRLRFDYQQLHAHSWTNAVLWGAGWAFVLIVFLLTILMGQLFALIGLHQLTDLLSHSWFEWTLVGAAFGAGIGLLRERAPVLLMLQRIATAILSVLTPLLAFGLVLFVLALPFTGLAPLWTTKQTTPILLVCILSAFLLVSATVGPSSEEGEARPRLLRLTALPLALVMLPLGIVAAISTGKRVGQYGLTPDRFWAITFVAVALACGLAYLAAILLRRRAWAHGIRRANIGLALTVCLIALFLALPFVSFGGLAARDQLARLESGRVDPDKFDWIAMRFDFGPAGVAALRRLQGSRSAFGKVAGRALAMQYRYEGDPWAPPEAPPAVPVLKTIPAGVPVPPALRSAVMAPEICEGAGDCLLYWKPGENIAIVLMDQCAERIIGRDAQTRPGVRCSIDPHVLQPEGTGWRDVSRFSWPSYPGPMSGEQERRMLEQERAAINSGDVQVREVKRRQVFVGGKPVGSVFE